MSKVIFSKEYDYESTYDLSGNVEEAFDPDYNPKIKNIPIDEHGYLIGKFTVTITWEEE